jgi:hypothetical protein
MNSVSRDVVIQVIDVEKHVSMERGGRLEQNPVPPLMRGLTSSARSAEPPHAQNQVLRLQATCLHLFSLYARRLADALADDIRNYLGWTVVQQGVKTWGDLVQEVRNGEPDMFIYSWNQREAHAG